MSETVELLEFLHGSLDLSEEEMSKRQQVSKVLNSLNGMLDITSLGALARNLYGASPTPSPHAAACDEMLANVEVSRVSTTALLALVRFTFMKRSLLPAWYALRDRAKQEIQAREPKEWRALLTGLLKEDGP